MSEFLYPIDILSTGEVRYYREFTNKHYKHFVKVILNEDREVFEMFTNSIIKELCASDIVPEELSSLDKMYILLCIRSYNISPDIEFVTHLKSDDETTVKISINVNSMLKVMESMEISHTFECVENDSIRVNCSLPKRMYYSSPLDLSCDCIDEMILNDKVVDIRQLTLEEKRSAAQQLPSTIVTTILNKLNEQEEIFKSIPISELDTEEDIVAEKQMFLSLFSPAIPEIIRLMYNTNLRDFYTNEYHLIRRFRFSYDSINNITPAELSVYHGIIAKDIEREKREMEKSQNSGGDSINIPQVQQSS